MKRWYVACVVMNALDALGTWLTVDVLHCAHELNWFVAAAVLHWGWLPAMAVKLALGTTAFTWLYVKRNERPKVIQWAFIFLTIALAILLGSQILAFTLSLIFGV